MINVKVETNDDNENLQDTAYIIHIQWAMLELSFLCSVKSDTKTVHFNKL